MANSNFVVHNGLTVGPLTINATTGDISTSGNISVTGPLGTNKISSGASNVTTTSSYVNVAVNGSNIASFGALGARTVIQNNLTVEGNLTVNGNVTYFNANNLTINDSLIYLADDNPGDILDIGFVSAFTSGGTGYQHTGFVRDATDGVWKLFANVVAEPTTTVDFTNANYANLRLDTLTGRATTAQYADLAENYQADAVYEPGTVLMFGGANEVTLADEGTARVAGVVSTNPAHLMNTDLVGDNVVAIALQGRVPVKVTGFIQKGDLMVSAGNGSARASAMPQVGCVIGKSLENFDGSEGVIEVVVGRV